MAYPYDDRLKDLALTGAQAASLFHYYHLKHPQADVSFEDFLGGVTTHDRGDYVGIHYFGMFVGIEKDGYGHT